MPVSYTNLRNSGWEFIVCKYLKRFEAWIGNAASMGGRHALLDSVITQISLYHMSMWLMNKTFIEKLDKHRRRFFWQGCNKKKRYYLVKWNRICRSKENGGLGIKDLRKQNISLMVKWWWKLETQNGVWQDIVRARYLRNRTVAEVGPRFSDSPCWKALLKVKEIYMVGRKITVESGNIARVWKDSINGLPPFQEQYPQLFDICNIPGCTVNQVGKAEVHSFFRRRLTPDLLDQWENIRKVINDLPLTDKDDRISWGLNQNGKFSTKSVYKWLEKPLSGCHYKWIWKAKIPLKIKIFLWQLSQDAVLTRQVMRKRKWPGNPTCSFCNEVETSQHLFFMCPVAKIVWRSVGVVLGTDRCPNNYWQFFTWCHAFLPAGEKFYTVGLAAACWAIWLARNRATFEKKLIKTPFEIVFSMCSFLLYWTGLQQGGDADKLRSGAEMIRASTMQLMKMCDAVSRPIGGT